MHDSIWISEFQFATATPMAPSAKTRLCDQLMIRVSMLALSMFDFRESSQSLMFVGLEMDFRRMLIGL